MESFILSQDQTLHDIQYLLIFLTKYFLSEKNVEVVNFFSYPEIRVAFESTTCQP